MGLELPLVVRLDGTNAEEGRAILAESAPPNLHVEPTMLDAARNAQWSWRRDRRLVGAREALPHESDAHREGATSTCSSPGPRAPRTALDVATGGGHVARRLREAGLEVVTLRPGSRDAPGRHLPRGGPALRRRELRRRRLPDRRAPLRGRRAARCASWPASRATASWSSTR